MGFEIWGPIIIATGAIIGAIITRSGTMSAAKMKATPPGPSGNRIVTGGVIGATIGIGIVAILSLSILSHDESISGGSSTTTETSASPDGSSTGEPSSPLAPPDRLMQYASKISLSDCVEPSGEVEVFSLKEDMPQWKKAYKCKAERGIDLNVYLFDFGGNAQGFEPGEPAKGERGNWRNSERSGRSIKYFQGTGGSRSGNIGIYDDRSDAIDKPFDIMIVSWIFPDKGSPGSGSLGRGIGYLESKGYSFNKEFKE